MYSIQNGFSGVKAAGPGGKCYTPKELGLDPWLWEDYPGLCVAEGDAFIEYGSKMMYTQPIFAAIAADILEARLKALIKKKGAPYGTNFVTEELKGARSGDEMFWRAIITYVGEVRGPRPKLKEPTENEVVNRLDKSKLYQRWVSELTVEDFRVGRGVSGDRVEPELRVTRTERGTVEAPQRPTSEVATVADVEEGVVTPEEAPPAAAAAAVSAGGWLRQHWPKVVGVGVVGGVAATLVGVLIRDKQED